MNNINSISKSDWFGTIFEVKEKNSTQVYETGITHKYVGFDRKFLYDRLKEYLRLKGIDCITTKHRMINQEKINKLFDDSRDLNEVMKKVYNQYIDARLFGSLIKDKFSKGISEIPNELMLANGRLLNCRLLYEKNGEQYSLFSKGCLFKCLDEDERFIDDFFIKGLDKKQGDGSFVKSRFYIRIQFKGRLLMKTLERFLKVENSNNDSTLEESSKIYVIIDDMLDALNSLKDSISLIKYYKDENLSIVYKGQKIDSLEKLLIGFHVKQLYK